MRYPETASLIRSARLRKGLSQEKAAAAVGCSRLQFIRWEQGLHKPDAHAGGLAVVLSIDEKALEAADTDEEEAQLPSFIDYAALDAFLLRRVESAVAARVGDALEANA